MSAHLRTDGYRRLSRAEGRRLEHVVIAERALGKPLPAGAQVHHIDRNPANNAPGNLVICPDQAYHRLLHLRQRALDAGCPADWRMCTHCKAFDAPANLRIDRHGVVKHLKCAAAYRRQLYSRRSTTESTS